MRLVIGSRGSHLALWQAHYVAGKLNSLGVHTEIVIIKTTGDHLQTASLVQAGGKGLFTKEIEEALLARTIDLAVHSLKDLPTEHPDGLTIAAVPEREDPRDAVVGCTLAVLPLGALVGTSSNRRGAQVRLMRPDLDVQPVRGNVDTRLRKLDEGQYSALLLAASGLRRLGLQDRIAETLGPEQMCPAPGQGALAIQTRADDPARAVCSALNDAATAAAVTCERSVLAGLGGGCQLPIGAFAEVIGGQVRVMAGVFSPDGTRQIRNRDSGPVDGAEAIGQRLASALIEQGARDLLTGAR